MAEKTKNATFWAWVTVDPDGECYADIVRSEKDAKKWRQSDAKDGEFTVGPVVKIVLPIPEKPKKAK